MSLKDKVKNLIKDNIKKPLGGIETREDEMAVRFKDVSTPDIVNQTSITYKKVSYIDDRGSDFVIDNSNFFETPAPFAQADINSANGNFTDQLQEYENVLYQAILSSNNTRRATLTINSSSSIKITAYLNDAMIYSSSGAEKFAEIPFHIYGLGLLQIFIYTESETMISISGNVGSYINSSTPVNLQSISASTISDIQTVIVEGKPVLKIDWNSPSNDLAERYVLNKSHYTFLGEVYDWDDTNYIIEVPNDISDVLYSGLKIDINGIQHIIQSFTYNDTDNLTNITIGSTTESIEQGDLIYAELYEVVGSIDKNQNQQSYSLFDKNLIPYISNYVTNGKFDNYDANKEPDDWTIDPDAGLTSYNVEVVETGDYINPHSCRIEVDGDNGESLRLKQSITGITEGESVVLVASIREIEGSVVGYIRAVVYDGVSTYRTFQSSEYYTKGKISLTVTVPTGYSLDRVELVTTVYPTGQGYIIWDDVILSNPKLNLLSDPSFENFPKVFHFEHWSVGTANVSDYAIQPVITSNGNGVKLRIISCSPSPNADVDLKQNVYLPEEGQYTFTVNVPSTGGTCSYRLVARYSDGQGSYQWNIVVDNTTLQGTVPAGYFLDQLWLSIRTDTDNDCNVVFDSPQFTVDDNLGILSNPSFEDWSGGKPDNWYQKNIPALGYTNWSTAIAQSTEYENHGTYSLELRIVKNTQTGVNKTLATHFQKWDTYLKPAKYSISYNVGYISQAGIDVTFGIGIAFSDGTSSNIDVATLNQSGGQNQTVATEFIVPAGKEVMLLTIYAKTADDVVSVDFYVYLDKVVLIPYGNSGAVTLQNTEFKTTTDYQNPWLVSIGYVSDYVVERVSNPTVNGNYALKTDINTTETGSYGMITVRQRCNILAGHRYKYSAYVESIIGNVELYLYAVYFKGIISSGMTGGNSRTKFYKIQGTGKHSFQDTVPTGERLISVGVGIRSITPEDTGEVVWDVVELIDLDDQITYKYWVDSFGLYGGRVRSASMEGGLTLPEFTDLGIVGQIIWPNQYRLNWGTTVFGEWLSQVAVIHTAHKLTNFVAEDKYIVDYPVPSWIDVGDYVVDVDNEIFYEIVYKFSDYVIALDKYVSSATNLRYAKKEISPNVPGASNDEFLITLIRETDYNDIFLYYKTIIDTENYQKVDRVLAGNPYLQVQGLEIANTLTAVVAQYKEIAEEDFVKAPVKSLNTYPVIVQSGYIESPNISHFIVEIADTNTGANTKVVKTPAEWDEANQRSEMKPVTFSHTKKAQTYYARAKAVYVNGLESIWCDYAYGIAGEFLTFPGLTPSDVSIEEIGGGISVTIDSEYDLTDVIEMDWFVSADTNFNNATLIQSTPATYNTFLFIDPGDYYLFIKLTDKQNRTGTAYDENVGLFTVSGMEIVPSLMAPTNLVLTEATDTVEVEFDVSADDNANKYEIWSSIGDESEYALIAEIKAEDITKPSTIKIIDRFYDRKTTIYYKVFACYNDNRSDVLSGNKTLTYSVSDPSTLECANSVEGLALTWTPPTSRLLDYIEVKKDANTVKENLSEGSAVTVYQGKGNSYTYPVPSADWNKWHQFWVSSITKT